MKDETIRPRLERPADEVCNAAVRVRLLCRNKSAVPVEFDPHPCGGFTAPCIEHVR